MAAEVKQATIVIEGVVQFVGFRSYIEEVASRYDLAGFVYNDLREANVKFVCEGNATNIEGLVKEIAKYPYVTRVHVKDEILLPKPVGRVVVGVEQEIFSRLDLGVERLNSIDMHVTSIDATLRENTGVLKENTEILKENTGVLKENAGVLKENSSLLRDIRGILHKIAEK